MKVLTKMDKFVESSQWITVSEKESENKRTIAGKKGGSAEMTAGNASDIVSKFISALYDLDDPIEFDTAKLKKRYDI